MDDKLIIETLAKAVKDGSMTLNDVPTLYKEQVETLLNEEA